LANLEEVLKQFNPQKKMEDQLEIDWSLLDNYDGLGDK
jgi:hypothetical protein